MGTQIGLTVFFLIGFGALLAFNEIVYRRLALKGEVTRKFAHFTATLSTITFPYLFNDHWYVLFLAVVFFLVLFISRNHTYLKSIHDIDRKSLGSYMLPVAIYLTFLISQKLNNSLLFILPMLILAISDPAAGILGINLQKYNHKIRLPWKTLDKTWLGSAAFFLSGFLISILALYFRQQQLNLELFASALIISLAGTLSEMLSIKGMDNLLIPMSVVLVMIIVL